MAVTSTEIGRRASVEVAVPDQLSWPMVVAMHLVPGALITAAFVVLAPFVEGAGYPAIGGLLLAIVLVLVPFELGVVLWASRSGGSALAAVPYRRPIAGRTWLWLVPALVLAAFVGFGAHQMVEPTLIKTFFGWLPDWFVTPIVLDNVRAYAPSTWVIVLVAHLAINGFVGPIVEELYFRGFLLPRMERLGRWAPLVNVSLFSLYHFWSPWQILARILGFGPTVYAVRAKRNVFLGMAVHCTLNSIAVILLATVIFGRL